jgi:hypothetical protein
MIKPHHVMIKPHHVMIKPHHVMIKPHHVMIKQYHIIIKTQISNFVRTMHFWNNLHHARSVKRLENQIIFKVFENRKTQRPNREDKQ